MRIYATIYKKYTEDVTGYLGTVDVTDSVSFGTQLHGGFSDCSFTVGGQKDLSFFRYRLYLASHVVLFDEYGRRVYEGFINKSSVSEKGVEVECLGYYAKADTVTFDMIYDVNPYTIYEITHDCISDIPEWRHVFANVGQANYNMVRTDPLSGDVIAIDFTDKKVREAIESLMGYGYREDDIRPIYFAIWEGRIPYLFPEPKPAKFPDWMVSIHSVSGGVAGISISLDTVFNRVFGVYDDQGEGPSKTLPAEDYLSQQRYGIREGTVQNGGTPEGLALANDLRDMALERYKYPRQVFTMEISGYIKSSAGFYDLPYRIRAGQQVLITDLDAMTVHAGTLAGQVAHGISGFVLRTDYDSSNHNLKIDFGASDVSFDILMSRLGLSGGLK
jgi:hypothetical protein